MPEDHVAREDLWHRRHRLVQLHMRMRLGIRTRPGKALPNGIDPGEVVT